MSLFIGISWQLFLLCCQHLWLPNSSSFNNGGCQPLTSWMGAHAMATTQQANFIFVTTKKHIQVIKDIYIYIQVAKRIQFG